MRMHGLHAGVHSRSVLLFLIAHDFAWFGLVASARKRMHGKSKEENMTDEREKKKCECTEGGNLLAKECFAAKTMSFI